MQAPYVEEQQQRASTRPAASPRIDLIAACQTDAAILFTGPTEAAEAMAREIHDSSGWRSGPFVVVDCGMAELELNSLLTWLFVDEVRDQRYSTVSARPSQYGVVFLRDVRKLPSPTQAKLADYLRRQRVSRSSGPRRRLMACTPTPVLPKTLGGTLSDELYYRLTPIHVMIGTTES